MHHCLVFEKETALRVENENRAAIEFGNKAVFTPATDGQHGSLILWEKYPDSDAYR